MGVPPVTLLPLALVAALCVTASARTWTVARLAVALTGVGVVTHAALWAGHGQTGSDAIAPGLAHHATTTGAAIDAASAHGWGLSPQMALAHVVAVALSVVLLRHGEVLLLWLVTLAERLLRPERGLLSPPDLRGFASSGVAPVLSSLVGAHGGQRAPPQLASI